MSARSALLALVVIGALGFFALFLIRLLSERIGDIL